MKKFLKRVFKLLIIALVLLAILISPFVFRAYKLYEKALTETGLSEKIAEIKEKESYVDIKDIPKRILVAFVASEDRRYYIHRGIDYIAIVRAAYFDIKSLSFKQGASTITQQLARNLYFSFEKSLERKFAEIFMAVHMEKNLSKDEILELYMNVIYFGNNCYGIKEASEFYFDKEISTLDKFEIDKLVLTIKSPNLLNPAVKD